MSTLRAEVIRLAHANPKLRPHLLPLLRQASGQDRQAARKDIKRMTPEEAAEWMGVISESVGQKAHAMEQHLNGEIREHQQTMKTLDRAWGKWDWATLADLGLLSHDDYRFVRDFNGTYSS